MLGSHMEETLLLVKEALFACLHLTVVLWYLFVLVCLLDVLVSAPTVEKFSATKLTRHLYFQEQRQKFYEFEYWALFQRHQKLEMQCKSHTNFTVLACRHAHRLTIDHC